jgi:hypothetical protein
MLPTCYRRYSSLQTGLLVVICSKSLLRRLVRPSSVTARLGSDVLPKISRTVCALTMVCGPRRFSEYRISIALITCSARLTVIQPCSLQNSGVYSVCCRQCASMGSKDRAKVIDPQCPVISRTLDSRSVADEVPCSKVGHCSTVRHARSADREAFDGA